MIYEKEIPEYAMQPAREPERVAVSAIYSPMKIIGPGKKNFIEYEFEEDILVPDVKPDMRTILFMDGEADMSPREKVVSPKTDDLVNLTGTVVLHTIYGTDQEMEIETIESKVPYKYQWDLNTEYSGNGYFDVSIKKVDYMVINERKFRAKIVLVFCAEIYGEKQYNIFQGIEGESLQMKKEKITVTNLGLIKKDQLNFDETFEIKEANVRPEKLIKEDFVITENYRQIAGEKIVINGFVFCHILYSGRKEGEEEEAEEFYEQNQRLEFTQFIPVEKEKRGCNWSCSRTKFVNLSLKLSFANKEEQPEEKCFRVKGDILTEIVAYETKEKEIIKDAYHREKNFNCDFTQAMLKNVVEAGQCEATCREIFPVENSGKVEKIIMCWVGHSECQGTCQNGKVHIEGKALCQILWQDQENQMRSLKSMVNINSIMDTEKAKSGEKAFCTAVVKNSWAEVINEKQIEVNCNVMISVEIYGESAVTLLENPEFVKDGMEKKKHLMVVATCGEKETLWNLAKKYKTTEERICQVNQVCEPLEKGKKLLVI